MGGEIEPAIKEYCLLGSDALKDLYVTEGYLNHIKDVNLKVDDYY